MRIQIRNNRFSSKIERHSQGQWFGSRPSFADPFPVKILIADKESVRISIRIQTPPKQNSGTYIGSY
jgi:hypothetical protein